MDRAEWQEKVMRILAADAGANVIGVFFTPEGVCVVPLGLPISPEVLAAFGRKPSRTLGEALEAEIRDFGDAELLTMIDGLPNEGKA